MPSDDFNDRFSANSLMVLEKRYLRRNEKGEITETPRRMFRRVANAVAEGDKQYGGEEAEIAATAEKFFGMMADLDFLSNSPTLMGAGTEIGQLAACFVLPIEDSMESIFEAIKSAALIHKSGGGTGFDFSQIRPKDDIVQSTGGIASGPVSFMHVFNAATEVVKQGSRRRGANMGLLRVDHPDIMEFISCKEQEGTLSNFNISVGITKSFMDALSKDKDYPLINPRTSAPAGRLRASEVMRRIAETAWRNGEPGLIFLDRINEFNPTPALGNIKSVNPCGETPLLSLESCVLGSINLSRMITEGKIDWQKLERVTKTAVHFLDNVITINEFPLPEIREATLLTRKIGLGVMGFAEMLIKLEIPYNSIRSQRIAAKVMEAISYWSKEASCDLAASRGVFPAYHESIYAKGKYMFPLVHLDDAFARQIKAPYLAWGLLLNRMRSGNDGLRNATTTTIAPTGSIALIAGTSHGIEPLFALAYRREHILDEDSLMIVNPLFEKVAREKGFYSADLMQEIAEKGSCQGLSQVPKDIQKVFVTAHDISPKAHISIQAAFQRHGLDNAASKTINLPHNATIEVVHFAFLEAYSLGCKGITIYRDRSRIKQVLSKGSGAKAGGEEATKLQPVCPTPRPRPDITRGITNRVALGCNRRLFITINEDPEGLCEVFVQVGKGGGCISSFSEAMGRLISLALRSSIPAKEIIDQLRGIRCPHPSWHEGLPFLSCADAVARSLIHYLGGADVNPSREPIMDSQLGPLLECPECGGPMEHQSRCLVCRWCGYSQCG